VSESHGTSGAAAAGTPASAGRGGAGGDGRRSSEPGMDERSQRLLQGGAASRAWADTAARETVRSDPGGTPVSAATSTYAVGGSGVGVGAAQTTTATRGSQPRRARLRVSHINPLSVLRLSLLFGACMLVVLLVAVAALWFVLDSAGVFSSITETTSTITDNSGSGTGAWFSFGRVMLITAVLGVLNVIAFTLLATVGSLLYNLCSDFVGGVEVTLSER
jgi:transmembrane protein DUF3566